MNARRMLLALGLVVVLAVAAAAAWRSRGGAIHYTGFVEGEERILRSEVTGRVVEVAFGEGDAVPANAVVARLADDDVQSTLASKRLQIAVQDADIRRQEEQVRLLETTWRTQLDAQRAELRQTEAGAVLAAQTLERERALVKSGASTAQMLDEARAGHDQARSSSDRARDLVARQAAEEGQITVARYQLDVLRAQRDLAAAELAELQVTASKYVIHAPAVATTVQTKFLWPGELAQPGSAVLSVLDPTDKYVQVYVPVGDLAAVNVGDQVEIELDSAPGRRVPGEITFLADQATFTPEKIESRSDRMGQVYRAKVRILAEVERFQPGTEGNVYLVGERQERGRDHGRLAAMSTAPPIAMHLRGLCKDYGRRHALTGIDLVLDGPQIVGIIGPDGAGKTTLLRAIVGLLDVTATSATVLGYDLTADVQELKQHVGYVPQAFSLHRDLSVLENLRFTARLHRLTESELMARAMPLLERTGLAPFVDRGAGALSGGMKQKLAIVNALLPEPSLLVLDEPTAGVDVVARGEIFGILDGRRRDTLIVVSTSYLDEMTLCDRLVYLDGGTVVATGTPEELRTGVAVELYRAWGEDAEAIARAARALPWVAETHASGDFARIEVPTATTPGPVAVRRTLAGLAGVHFAERVPVDMEATLLALARTTAHAAGARPGAP